MRTRVKICGITRDEDALAAASCGVDAIGLVFYPGSPRHIDISRAARIARSVPPFVMITGLFVNAPRSDIEQVLNAVPLGLLQFHGQETNDECSGYGLPFIKSIAMRDDIDVLMSMEQYPDAAGFLLDAWQPQRHGGSGETFNWERVPTRIAVPVILAGGLSAENITTAIQTVRPYAVDVSSGVESEKGIKSADKISAFMKGVRRSGTDPDS